jgi:hypothetical protein
MIKMRSRQTDPEAETPSTKNMLPTLSNAPIRAVHQLK